MKNKNNLHTYRQILACAMVLCLLGASVGVQPAQAGSKSSYWLSTHFFTPEFGMSLCNNRKLDVVVDFLLNYYQYGDPTTGIVELIPVGPQGDVEITISATEGSFEQASAVRTGVEIGRIYTPEFVYIAPEKVEKETMVKLVASLKIAKLGVTAKTHQTIFIKPCNAFNIRGTSDTTKVNGAAMVIPGWDPMGTYDIYGTLQANEDGSLSGQAYASLFVDAMWTGEGLEDIEFACDVLRPWEGTTTVDIEADPNAWAHEGELDLTFNIQPMQLSATTIACQGDGGYGSGGTPSFTIAQFNLDFDALSSDGDSTNLDFHYPQGQGELEMHLIVTPEEAQS